MNRLTAAGGHFPANVSGERLDDVRPESAVVTLLLGDMPLDSPRRVAATYMSKESLPVFGKCKAPITVPETGGPRETDFIVIQNAQVSLLSNKTSKELRVLKINVDADTLVNTCRPSPADRWPYLHDKYMSIFKGLGKLEDSQSTLHIDKSV